MRAIYLDNHATTAVDPRELEAMLPLFCSDFGNAGSSTHAYGRKAKQAVDASRERIAAAIEHTLGIRIKVSLVEPHTITRGEGKANRLIDLRKL